MAVTLPPPAAAPTTSLPPAQVQRIQRAAQDFEALALGSMLEPMFATIDPSKGLFGGGEAEAAWRPLMVAELAKHIASHGGLGLGKPILQQMLQMQEGRT